MINDLIIALNEGRTAAFIYDDRQRVVEVHAIGHSTKDNSVIMRGYQVAGQSSRPLPAWALFTLDKITALTLSAFVDSDAPREGYKMGDRQMTVILSQIELEPAL